MEKDSVQIISGGKEQTLSDVNKTKDIKENKLLEIKRNQITLLVQAYYRKFKFLQKSSEKELIEKAINKYLYTDLTIDQINDETI